MTTNALRWTLIGGLAVALALTLWARGAVMAQLQNQMEQSRVHQRELAGLQAEHQRLLETQPTSAEMDALRADHDALRQMEEEIAQTRRRLAAPPVSKPVAEPATSTPLKPLSSDHWKNAGNATPAATLETALWAASGGNLDTLAGLLTLDPAAAGKAQEIFNSLPSPAKAEYRSAERLVALLTTKDAPTGSLQIIGQKQVARDEVAMRVRLQDADGSTKFTTLRLQQANKQWQLVVPEKAMDRYASILKGTEAQPQSSSN
jgi:hypothetical protein